MKRLLLVLAAVASLQACASVASPVLKPVSSPAPLLLGMNDGGHTGVPRPIVDRYCATNRELVIRAAVLSVDEARVVLDSLVPCRRLHGLLLVEKNDLALVQALAGFSRTRADLWGIELGNELDLAGLTSWQFNDFIATAWGLLRNAGYEGQIVTGGIYTVDDHRPQDFLTYLRPALDSCPDCIVGLHWYGNSSNEWLARVQQLGRPVIVSEFGQPSRNATEDSAQLSYLREKLADYARTGNVIAAIVYQRLSGPSTSNLDNFGIQRFSGDWKPSESIFWGQP